MRLCIWALLLVPVACLPGPGSAQTATRARAVALATLPLPLDLREGAAVVTLGATGKPDTIRAGSNSMVCFTDNPGDTLLDVRCYHSSFVPLIYAARALSRAGLPWTQVEARMAADIRAGRLKAPPFPTAGYRVLGPIRDYDPVTGRLGPSIDHWQSIHMPFATAGDLGMDTLPHGASPYLMAAGTWWAHVMIMQAPLRY